VASSASQPPGGSRRAALAKPMGGSALLPD
jgi:hypothetical protein